LPKGHVVQHLDDKSAAVLLSPDNDLPALKQMGVDEIYRGKNDKFLTVVSNLETGEPLWFGKERKRETGMPFGFIPDTALPGHGMTPIYDMDTEVQESPAKAAPLNRGIAPGMRLIEHLTVFDK